MRPKLNLKDKRQMSKPYKYTDTFKTNLTSCQSQIKKLILPSDTELCKPQLLGKLKNKETLWNNPPKYFSFWKFRWAGVSGRCGNHWWQPWLKFTMWPRLVAPTWWNIKQIFWWKRSYFCSKAFKIHADCISQSTLYRKFWIHNLLFTILSSHGFVHLFTKIFKIQLQNS